MTAVQFYTDEHVPRAVVDGLRYHGADVLTTPEAGMMGQDDSEHLALALRESRVLYTQDDDFLTLAALGVPHAGIAYLRQGEPIGRAVRGLLAIYRGVSAEGMVNQLRFL